MAAARSSFNVMVIAPALHRSPQRQIDYLLAMAHCETVPAASGDIAQAMGLTTKEASPHRKRLIDAAAIEKIGYGKVNFAIPYMREYLREHAEELGEGR